MSEREKESERDVLRGRRSSSLECWTAGSQLVCEYQVKPGREGGRGGGREGGRKEGEGREGGREGRGKGGREEGREGGREEGREEGREGGREGGKEEYMCTCESTTSFKRLTTSGGTDTTLRMTLFFMSGMFRWRLTLSESLESFLLISAMDGLLVKSSLQHLSQM